MGSSPQSGASGEPKQSVLRADSPLVGVGVFLIALLLYLFSFGVRDDGQLLGNDAMPYAHQLARGDASGLFNAHHLLFHPIVLGIAKLRALIPGVEFNEIGILAAQQWLSALGGALAVLMVFRFASRCAGQTAGGWIAAIFACCYGNWLYSAVGETYSPATGVIAILLVQAAEVRLGWRRENLAALSAWLLLAVAFRQDSVLVVCALPFLLGPRSAFAVTGAAGLLALLGYVSAWALSGLEIPFETWLRGLADSGIWGNPPTLQSFAYSAGLVAASVHCGIVHLRRALGGNTDVLLDPIVIAAMLSIAMLIACVLRPRPIGGRVGLVVIGMGVFVAARYLFFTWWEPTNLEYHTGTLLPLFLGLALLFHPQSRLGKRLFLPASFVLIAVGNYVNVFAPNRVETVSEHTALAIEEAGAGGLLIAMNANQYHALLREPPPNADVIDAVDIFVRGKTIELPRLQATVRERIDRGLRVVLVRERGFWERMGFAERPMNVEAVDRLVSEFGSRPLVDEDGVPWALVLEP